ncbi:hypothetical protein CFOL_v3_18953 [Cephalotus follicularis]|uniref:Uncharacterized protein n=1 Tax=Cephalotus follicularis TaxID=3775 RepID=A0A1Q3C5K7_CEPFO|nr:hypothetical protein CFOL_v3_18953 [Cephalotus follicularis]
MVMVTKEKDEELALFLELRRREKEKDKDNNTVLVNDSVEVIAHFVGSNLPRKTAADKFLNSEIDKSDYDWLLTPPGTPQFPSLGKESQRSATNPIGMSDARTSLKPWQVNVQEEPASRSNTAPKNLVLSSGLNLSSITSRRPSSSGGPKSAGRSATPTGRQLSRPSSPISRATLPSTKPAAPSRRSSTPARSTARSSTPTTRPSLSALKPTSRAATPTRRSSTPPSAPSVTAPSRSSSVTKSHPMTSKNPVLSRGPSPTVKSRPWKPSEMPGFSLDAPPNLRTTSVERPVSASRGRPGTPSARASSVEATSNGRPARRSCSPARGRTSNGSTNGNGSSIPFIRRAHSNGSDNVSPVVIGTKMVERVVNMRKLAPPRQDDDHLSTHSISGGKSSSLDSSGFGRTLSKKSLDMAMRHMDIKRSISGNLRPIMTNIPASSMYSVRSGSTKSRTVSVSDSPLATSSNASSEPSVSNNFICLDSCETEYNDLGSERGNTSPASQRCRFAL